MQIIDSVMERLSRSEAYKNIVKLDEQEQEDQRAAAAKALERAAGERSKRGPLLLRKRDAAFEALRTAQTALVMADREHRTAAREVQNLEGQFQMARRDAETALRQTAPPEVFETRRWIDSVMQKARGSYVSVSVVPTQQPHTDPKPTIERSNAATVTTVAEACIAGIRRCDELLLATMSRAAIRAELRVIVASIPRIDTALAFEVDLGGRAPMFERVETAARRK
jgi:hypothetical protein